MRRAWRLFGCQKLLRLCFLLEYYSPVCGSTAESHLRLLDHVVSGAAFLLSRVSTCNLGHRRKVYPSSILYKIYFRNGDIFFRINFPLFGILLVLLHCTGLLLILFGVQPLSHQLLPCGICLMPLYLPMAAFSLLSLMPIAFLFLRLSPSLLVLFPLIFLFIPAA